ncbi:hypothetical protein, partial [Nocardia salmonicida]|uniref:hypothetical protein n=1 Tax=Nocardia salmonicida TaxID=53431 RepID=UPI003669CA3A
MTCDWASQELRFPILGGSNIRIGKFRLLKDYSLVTTPMVNSAFMTYSRNRTPSTPSMDLTSTTLM